MRRFLHGLLTLLVLWTLAAPVEAQIQLQPRFMPKAILAGKSGITYFGAYTPEAVALFAAMTTPPSTQDKADMNAYIVCEQAAGIWSIWDNFKVAAVTTAQAATLNWKNPATYQGVNAGATFTPYQGWNGDGASTYYNDTWAVTNGPNFTQDAGTLAVWSGTAGQQTNSLYGTNTGTVRNLINPRNAADSMVVRLNTITQATFPNTDGRGLFLGSRTGAASGVVYKNGVSQGTFSTTSGAPQAGFMAVGRVADLFSSGQAYAMFGGGAMNATQQLAHYNCTRAYMTAKGVP